MHAATLRLVKVFHQFNTVESPGGRNLLGGSFPLGGFPMLDTATTALLRAVLEEAREVVADLPADVLARTAAFLLLKDSRSSFEIEGEHPP